MARTIALIGLSAVVLVGCGSERVPVGEGSGSQSGAGTETGNESGSASATSGASATSTSGASEVTTASSASSDAMTTGLETTSFEPDSSTGLECKKGDCAQCPPPLVNVERCVAGELVCGCELQRPCEVLEVACAYLELDPSNADNAVDCGIATLADALDGWEAVSTCIQDAAMNEVAFKGAFEIASGDTPTFAGFIGITGGVAYQLKEIRAETPGLGNQVEARDCTDFAAGACTVEVGTTCIECNPQGEFSTVCQESPE